MEATVKHSFPDVVVVAAAKTTQSTPEPGLTRVIGSYNDKLLLAEHRLEKGWAGTRHSHPHDQLVYVVSGHLKITCGDQTFEVRGGDSFVVRGGIEHQASAIEPSHAIDVFTPCREDYL
jgi:quercetin dioxygenase-like cupin family protein